MSSEPGNWLQRMRQTRMWRLTSLLIEKLRRPLRKPRLWTTCCKILTRIMAQRNTRDWGVSHTRYSIFSIFFVIYQLPVFLDPFVCHEDNQGQNRELWKHSAKSASLFVNTAKAEKLRRFCPYLSPSV